MYVALKPFLFQQSKCVYLGYHNLHAITIHCWQNINYSIEFQDPLKKQKKLKIERIKNVQLDKPKNMYFLKKAEN